MVHSQPDQRLARSMFAIGISLALVSAIVVFGTGSRAAPAAATSGPTKVVLTDSSGSPLRTASGSLGAVDLAPGHPLHLQLGKVVQANVPPVRFGIVANIRPTQKVSISDITVTCGSCASGANQPGQVGVVVFDANAANCDSVPATGVHVIALLVASDTQQTTEFTYPTGRVAPIDILPTGLWCIGVSIAAVQTPKDVYVSLDGAES